MRYLITILMAFSLVGCATYTTPEALPPRELTAEQRNFEAVFLSAQAVLRDEGFDIDRRDRRRGEVATHPMVAGQNAELWRRDSTDLYHRTENMLHKVFLVAVVTITPVGTSGEYSATVDVERLRSSTPEHDFSRSGYASGVLTPGGASHVGATEGRPNFDSLGTDESYSRQLEARIMLLSEEVRWKLDMNPYYMP
jgi:hypothetical protein